MPGILEGDDKIADIFGEGSALLSGDWMGLGIKLLGLGQSTDISQAASGSDTLLNTSGYVIGKGNAEGGTLSTTKGSIAALPWYVWAAGALVGIAIVKRSV